MLGLHSMTQRMRTELSDRRTEILRDILVIR